MITNATYNENGMWSDEDEKALLEFLDKVNAKGFLFALSNVLESKNQKNDIYIIGLKVRDTTAII